jgi:Bacterial TniB protein
MSARWFASVCACSRTRSGCRQRLRASRTQATDAKRDQVVAILRRVNLGMIIVDEIHHLLAGSYVKQRNCLNVLKYLGNELCVPIVGIGTAEAMPSSPIGQIRLLLFVPEQEGRMLPSQKMPAKFRTGYPRCCEVTCWFVERSCTPMRLLQSRQFLSACLENSI